MFQYKTCIWHRYLIEKLVMAFFLDLLQPVTSALEALGAGGRELRMPLLLWVVLLLTQTFGRSCVWCGFENP